MSVARPLSIVLAVAAVVGGGYWYLAGEPKEDSGPKLTHKVERGELLVSVTQRGILESSDNHEIKCGVRGRNTVLWVIPSGTFVKPGDLLIRLDRAFIEEQIDERTKYANWSHSSAVRSKADVARAKIAVEEYDKGRYTIELMNLKKDLEIAEARLRTSENRLSHTQRMAASGYISGISLEQTEFSVEQARREVKLKRTEIDVLERFTRKEQKKSLDGELKATIARHEANAERDTADASRRDRALEEIKHCEVRADRHGMVIHPSAAKWLTAPIAEGTNVHKHQVLLLMPNLQKMQVKIGIHEEEVDSLKPGLPCRVRLATRTTTGKVAEVASVARPAGIWSANEVRYDTLIELPPEKGLRPGMSAEVEIIVAHHKDVLKIPVAAVNDDGVCWVKTSAGIEQRHLKLGDSNGVFSVVEDGLEEGDEVILNAGAFDDEDPNESDGAGSSEP